MTNARRIRLFLPLPVVAVAALVWPLSRPDAPEAPQSAAQVAYESLPEAPKGEIGVGRAGVEPSAVAHAAWLKAIPSAEGSEVPCDPEKLSVSWAEPPSTATHGRFIPPLGPAPSATTNAVNGIVQCEGSENYAFMGFQARYVSGEWEIQAVPNVGAEHDHLEEVTAPEPEAPAPAPMGPVTLDGRTFGAGIEGLAAYEPQRTCSATAKPGTAAMRNMLLRDNAGSRNLGIVRGCGIGGQSEHKEGRAFDWGVYVSNAKEKAYAETFVNKLLATDEHGNKYALARRMGIMYVIWNKKIWSAYRASDGWRPYGGASPHTDHVHISLSWAGATAKTSFWSGNVVDVLLAAAPTGEGRSTSTASAARARKTTLTTEQIAARQKADAERRAAREQQKAEARKAWEEKRAAELQRRAEGKAKWEAERLARAERRKLEDEAKALARTEAKAKYESEKQARDEARALARAEAKAKYEAEKVAKAERYAAEKLAKAERYAAEKAARDALRKAAAEKYAAEKAARDAARRATTTTTVPRSTTTTVPRWTTTTTVPRTTTTTVPRTTTTTAPPATTTTTAAPATTTTTEAG